MTKDRWLEIRDIVAEKFGSAQSGEDFYEEEGGTTVEWLEFEGPLGLMRLEYETRPVIVDKKTHGSNRMGSEAKVQYIYSETEKSAKLFAFKFDESSDSWLEIDLSQISFNN
jgi:hypothetical protein